MIDVHIKQRQDFNPINRMKQYEQLEKDLEKDIKDSDEKDLKDENKEYNK